MEKQFLLKMQKNEITEHKIYSKLARKTNDPHNKKILEHIAKDEMVHYNILKKVTKQDVKSNNFRVKWYIFLSAIFGLSFTLMFMENGEKLVQEAYRKVSKEIAGRMHVDEQRHEKELLKMIKEARISYASSVVLGLNDALVELTGMLAGLTFALSSGKIIAVIGFITGVAASMSMAASEYLSSREEESDKVPTKGALYTGAAYIVTVLLLISPYVFISNVFMALATTITISILIIAFYTFYISTAKAMNFKRKFFEMVAISLSVAAISFIIGWIVKTQIGIDI